MAKWARGGRDRGRPVEVAEALLRASDPVDVAVWEALMDEEIHIRIGNRHPVIGRAAAAAELGRLFGGVRALGQRFREVWPGVDGQTVLMELDLTTRTNALLPLAIALRVVESHRVKDLRFYLDPAPLESDVNAGADSALMQG